MKTLSVVAACLVMPLMPSNGGPFYNLDFEQVIQPLIPNDPWGYNRVPIGNALPGWRAFAGSAPVTLVHTNTMFLDSAGISLYGPGGAWVINGNYSAFLQSGFPINNATGQISAAIAQNGQVPSDAQSIRLAARAWGLFSVSLGGETLSLTPLFAGADFTIYGANIPNVGGQTEELRITAQVEPGAPGFQHSLVWLDSISFSPEVVVPEPSVVALVLCGGLLLGLNIFRKRHKS
jgi:hypothetical protein